MLRKVPAVELRAIFLTKFDVILMPLEFKQVLMLLELLMKLSFLLVFVFEIVAFCMSEVLHNIIM